MENLIIVAVITVSFLAGMFLFAYIRIQSRRDRSTANYHGEQIRDLDIKYYELSNKFKELEQKIKKSKIP